MRKSKRKQTDENQLLLFPSDSPSTSSEVASTFTRFERVMDEMKRQRMKFTTREQYYLSPEWQYKRRQKLEQVGNRCERCGKLGRLDIHHLNYNSLYDERMEDLQALCRDCHGPADSAREYNSAFSTYLYKRFGDDACMIEPADYADEFDNWLDNKREDW